MIINSIQYGMKQNKVALLTTPVELLVKIKFLSLTALSPGITTALNSLLSRWKRLDPLIVISSKESSAWS